MTNIDKIISNIDPGDESLSKDILVNFVKESLNQIKNINDHYKILFEGKDGSDAYIPLIEEKLEKLTNLYKNLFPGGLDDTSIIDELESKISDIRQYNQELLTNENSIKEDIKNSQDKIISFYVELLGEDSSGGKAKEIRDFYEELTKSEGTKEQVEKIHTEIVEKYEKIFTASEGENSIIVKLENNIKEIDSYRTKIDKEINPEVENVRKYINDVQKDIDTKSADIDSLLSDATARTLAEGYTESKYEYSKEKSRKYVEGKYFLNIGVFFFNHILRHLSTVVNYAMFILPLVAVSLIFINEKTAEIILSSFTKNDLEPSPLELIYVKTIVSVPLIWIAWYGQRNISQRKRLFEEYNHKLRVVQMYLLFNTADKSYHLSDENKEELSVILLDAIKNNPAQYLGRGETMIDRIIDRFYERGLIKKLKEEIIPIFPEDKVKKDQ